MSTPAPAYDPVAKAATLAWKPADRRPPWRWAEDYYVPPVSALSAGGKWRSETSPWVREVMETFADNSIRQITVLCSAQSSKTETMLALLSWIVAEDPSPTMWITSSEDEALKFCNERLMPALRSCPPVASSIPDDRTLAKTTEILFPTMMLEAVGANAKAKLQSRPRRFLLCDEVRNWPAWALPMAKARVTTFWNSRIVILTTPEKERDTVHNEFLNGDQRHYHVPCLNEACDYSGPLDWANMKAAHPTETDATGRPRCVKWSDVPGAKTPDGKWDFDKLAPHVRYVCPRCGHLHQDRPDIRRTLADRGQWVPHNPSAPAERRSYTWNALLPYWIKWSALVQQFVQAEIANDYGDFEPLKAFVTEKLGQPWTDRMRYGKSDSYIDDRVVDFTDAKLPPFVPARRFMMVDVQGKGGRHFYWGVFDFAQGGAHRAVAWGKAWSVEELRALQTTYHVPSSNVGIDSGHWAAEVYRYVLESGQLPDGNYAWKAMKGDKAPHYTLALGDGKTLRLPYTWSFVDPYLGSEQAGRAAPLRQLLFSKSSMLDRAEACMRGVGPRFEINGNGEDLHEFKMQLTAYERRDNEKANGVIETEWVQKRPDDHWGSVYRQALAAACATGLMEIPQAKG